MDAIRDWWDCHRAVRSDLAHLIIRSHDMGLDAERTRTKIMGYLTANKSWLPCGPDEFIRNYMLPENFWPEF